MRNSSIFSIATTLTLSHEGYQVGIFIPPKVGNFTPPVTLVIRSDLDTRGFYVPLVYVVAVLEGDPQAVRLLATGEEIGTVKSSASAKAVNFWIDPFLYTTPMTRVMEVLERMERKAAVFVGRGGG